MDVDHVLCMQVKFVGNSAVQQCTHLACPSLRLCWAFGSQLCATVLEDVVRYEG